MKKFKTIYSTLVAGLVLGLYFQASPAFADSSAASPQDLSASHQNPVLESPQTQTFEIQVEVNPGSAPISYVWSERQALSRSSWGASYATSSEILYLFYQGKARAGGNVYQGLRIVKVCIWYSRDGQQVTPKVCSNATGGPGYWAPGPEVTIVAQDSLGWEDSKTTFHIETTRISPIIFY
jgi:hypothetical protein